MYGGSSVGRKINGKKILAVTRQSGGSSRKGDGNHGKSAHCMLPKGLPYIQVSRMRKHNACRRQEVQFGGSSIQHCILSLHLLPCHTGRTESHQGSLAHLAQAVPYSVTACLRSTSAGLALTSSADICKVRGSNSTGQASSIHPRAGHGAHLFHSLKHWLQPLAVDFTVTVQEGEDVSSCNFSSSHPRADQPYEEKGTAKEQEGLQRRHLSLLQKKYFVWPWQGKSWWFSCITSLSTAEISFRAGHTLGTVRWALPAHNDPPVTSVHDTTSTWLLTLPFQPSPQTPGCCLLTHYLIEYPVATITNSPWPNCTPCFFPSLLLICFIPICPLFCPAEVSAWLSDDSLLSYTTSHYVGYSLWTKQWFLSLFLDPCSKPSVHWQL